MLIEVGLGRSSESMTYDHSHTTHREHQSSGEICLCHNPWVEKRGTELEYSSPSGGCTVFEAWENWGVTIPSFWRESDEMRYLSGKSMGVQVLCIILEDKKRKLQNRACRKM